MVGIPDSPLPTALPRHREICTRSGKLIVFQEDAPAEGFAIMSAHLMVALVGSGRLAATGER